MNDPKIKPEEEPKVDPEQKPEGETPAQPEPAQGEEKTPEAPVEGEENADAEPAAAATATDAKPEAEGEAPAEPPKPPSAPKPVLKPSGKALSVVVISSITILLAVIILGGGYFLFIRSKWKELNQMAVQINQQEHILAYLKTGNQGYLPDNVKQRAKLKKLAEKIPYTSSISTILDDVSRLAKDSSLVVMNFAEQEPVPFEALMQIPVTVTLTGRYDDLLNFIKSFGKLKRLVTIEGMNISVFSAVSERVILSVTLQLAGYRVQQI